MRPSDPNAGVPIALAIRPHWIVWKLSTIAGKPKKIAFNPLTLRPASTMDPSAWSTLAKARTALETRCFTGLGFCFKRGDGIFGVDLDSCFTSLFNLAEWAQQLVWTFRTYAEVSPSGGGVKLFGLGRHDIHGSVKIMDPPSEGTKRAAIEVYGWGRFFAFTGRKLDDVPAELVECQAKLDGLLKTMSPGGDCKVSHSQPAAPRRPTETPLLERGRLYLAKVPPTRCGTGTCSKRTFRAAVVLLNEIGLDPETVFLLLRRWSDKGQHRFSDAEIMHKINSAAAK